MAKVLTGLDLSDGARRDREDQQSGVLLRPDVRGGSRARHHREDRSSATSPFPPGRPRRQDLDSVLDALMAQPTMAPFVCQQLIQHLVTSNPSPAYIQRVSNVFLNDGSGVRGDHAGRDHRDSDRSGSARGRRSERARSTRRFGHLREPILFMANHAARPERDARRQQRDLQRRDADWAKTCSTRPACSAISRRSLAPKRVCSAPSFRSIRRRPRPTARRYRQFGDLTARSTRAPRSISRLSCSRPATRLAAQLHQLRFPASAHVERSDSRRPPMR